MSFTPPPHPNTRPRQDRLSPSDREARGPLFAYRSATLGEFAYRSVTLGEFARLWLAHVEAVRIGRSLSAYRFTLRLCCATAT